MRESEERLRFALIAAKQGMYDLNVQTGEQTRAPEYATMLGYDPAEFKETPGYFFSSGCIRTTATGSPRPSTITWPAKSPEYRVEFRQRTKEGGWRWVLSMGRIVSRDAEGRPRDPPFECVLEVFPGDPLDVRRLLVLLY